jgi:cyclophilin family peptidyl-prolyl cis-trans isomerase
VKEGRDAAVAACRDPNATMRAHAKKSLASFPDADATCAPPDAAPDPAPEIASPASAATLRFDTDAGPLSIRFDPALAPIASARMIALAKSGFYGGVVVHRVVPGFVVQFGDPGGDGYGGSGKLLRCETSPVAFDTLDVGVALAGRDTGSSQLFVTLARYPHLEGEYTRVGRAEGDWAALAEGDVIRDVKVEE